MWFDPWLRESNGFHVVTPVNLELQSLKVQDLMVPRQRARDVELIEELFVERDVSAIISIPLCSGYSFDKRVWHHSKNGLYSVKSGYWATVNIWQHDQSYASSGRWMKIWNL